MLDCGKIESTAGFDLQKCKLNGEIVLAIHGNISDKYEKGRAPALQAVYHRPVELNKTLKA
jgi:hypothetical protein